MNSLLLAAALAVTNSAAVLPTKSTSEITTIPTVVIEASRLEAAKTEIPSHVDVIDRAAIESSGAANVVELLEKRANLFVRKQNSNPAQAQVSMRGFGANGFGRVKILVDGEELNNPDMAPQELMRVPLAGVGKVEVLHGPQTVLHGSEASAGVINISSDDEQEGRKSELEVRGGSWGCFGIHAGTRGGATPSRPEDDDSPRSGSAPDVGSPRSGSAPEVGSPRSGSAPGNIRYYADFDYERSDGWRRNSWYEIWSGKAGIKQKFADGSWWSLKTFYSNTSYGLPGGIWREGGMREGGRSKEEGVRGWKERAREVEDEKSWARNDVYGVSVAGKFVIDDEQSVTSEFSFRERQSTSYDYLEYDVFTLGWKVKYTWDCEVNRLDVGVDVKGDIMDVNGYNPKTMSGGDNDFTRFCGAVFARDEVKFGEAWSVFAGARGEWWQNKDEYFSSPREGARGTLGEDPREGARGTLGEDPREGARGTKECSTRSEVAGEAGVVWRPVEQMKVFAKWARFYHAPLADEMFSSYGVPNMALKPESGHNFELGWDWTFLDHFNFNITGFHSEIDDEIMYMNYGNRNANDHTARTGLETSLVWSEKDVGSAGVLYSYTYARFTEGEYEGNDVPLVPRQLLRAFGEYWIIDWLAINGGMRFVGEQRHGGDFAAEGGWMPSFAIFDVGLKIKPKSGWLEGFTIAATVDNLFDKRYFDYGESFGPQSHYIYPAAGRSFLITIRYEF